VTTSQSHTGFGDISFTPRVLLHETKDFSLTAELAVLTPTGDRPLAGMSALTPAVGFWTNFAGGWVIRGGIGDFIPTQGGGNTLISQLAVGQTLTEHDVPLVGDFTYYLSAVVDTPLSGGDHTSVTLTPGVRMHLGRDWSFLAGLPTPLTKARVADLGMILWFVKAW
jgi:Putative MetA-pathway of phenol degradation